MSKECNCDCHRDAMLPEGMSLRLSLYGKDGKVVAAEETTQRISIVSIMNDGRLESAKAEVIQREGLGGG